jgi:hypothetical protein
VKWVALILILLVIVIVFGLWRRMSAAPHPDAALPADFPHRGDAAPSSLPPAATPAAESGADEVTAAPAVEQPPTDPAEAAKAPRPEDWWQERPAEPPR